MEKSFVVDDGRNSMSTQHSTLVAVFQDRAMAEQAIEKLQDAGFQNDQLHYSGGNTRAGVLSAIKNLFTGEDYPTSKNLVGDLENMGIPDEEAEYYAREHQAGHPIVAIDAGDHVREAEEILKQNGASRYGMNSGAASIAAEQVQEMPSNEEIQGIGNYTSETGYAQPANSTPLSSDVATSDQPYNVVPSLRNTQTSDNPRAADLGQDSVPAQSGTRFQPYNSDDADDLSLENEYDYGQSGEGENTSGYAQTDNALRGVDSTQSPITTMPGSTPQNRLDQQPTGVEGQDQALRRKLPEQKQPDDSSRES